MSSAYEPSEAITPHSLEARGERGIHAKSETGEKRDARGGKKQTYLAAPLLNFCSFDLSFRRTPFDQTFGNPLTFNNLRQNFAALFATPLARISDVFDDANQIYF